MKYDLSFLYSSSDESSPSLSDGAFSKDVVEKTRDGLDVFRLEIAARFGVFESLFCNLFEAFSYFIDGVCVGIAYFEIFREGVPDFHAVFTFEDELVIARKVDDGRRVLFSHLVGGRLGFLRRRTRGSGRFPLLVDVQGNVFLIFSPIWFGVFKSCFEVLFCQK